MSPIFADLTLTLTLNAIMLNFLDRFWFSLVELDTAV